MKSFHTYLQGIIAVGSLASFLGGWSMLAHAPKPVTNNPPAIILSTTAVALPTLVPLAPLPGESMPALQPLLNLPTPAPIQRFALPPLRTRGS